MSNFVKIIGISVIVSIIILWGQIFICGLYFNDFFSKTPLILNGLMLLIPFISLYAIVKILQSIKN